jgi:2,5-diamino-6-(ribosylamino)-4(3H)-pyrimidinone 5'-phosphate reductase
MAMSVDGKITTRRREEIVLGTEHDRRMMDELRSGADAVIVGAGTVKYDGYPVLVRYKDLVEKRVARGLSPHPVNIVLSRRLDFPATRPFFTRTDTEKIIFTTRTAPVRRVNRFAKLAEVIVLPKRTLPPGDVLKILYDRSFKRVLMEGGGEMHFAFAKAGVIDDVYITLTPRLIGGATTPTVLDGRGFLAADHLRLRLVSTKREGDELFLKYKVVHR